MYVLYQKVKILLDFPVTTSLKSQEPSARAGLSMT